MGVNKWAELVISLIRIMDIHESNWDAVLLFIPYLQIPIIRIIDIQ